MEVQKGGEHLKIIFVPITAVLKTTAVVSPCNIHLKIISVAYHHSSGNNRSGISYDIYVGIAGSRKGVEWSLNSIRYK